MDGFSTRGSFFLPAFCASSTWILHSSLIVRCAVSMASMMRLSGTWRAEPSTIVMPFRVPATTRVSVLSSIWSKVGLTTSAPFTYPMRTAPIGPSNGMSEMVIAAEAAFIARISGGLTRSVEMTIGMTWISRRKSLENRGRMGRSMSRDTRTSLSLGRPSRLMKPPGILPAA